MAKATISDTSAPSAANTNPQDASSSNSGTNLGQGQPRHKSGRHYPVRWDRYDVDEEAVRKNPALDGIEFIMVKQPQDIRVTWKDLRAIRAGRRKTWELRKGEVDHWVWDGAKRQWQYSRWGKRVDSGLNPGYLDLQGHA
ncbi:Uu.00g023480.m01.CDS01 [Anthostomella pinea]|uniref:Uu.00g023480.m01.CDS01 n=1 Tax=Anthostomella pinea TaxID=933095 RepID=A0AAI8W015_9PEZI|nr:Uu.00g023480.m01.CDS01 [Anthostomella pinea]